MSCFLVTLDIRETKGLVTEALLNFIQNFTCNLHRFITCVKDNGNFIIIQQNFIDKNTNE